MIVAFLQNQWFPGLAAKRMEMLYAKHGATPDDRADMNARYLFFRCLTGQRLRDAFGEDLCDKIVWENANPKIGSKSSDRFPPDPEHIRKVLDHFKPKAVLALGAEAGKGVADTRRLFDGSGAWTDFVIVTGPHPAGRAPDVMDKLRACGSKLREIEA
jgi:hypothetical protein